MICGSLDYKQYSETDLLNSVTNFIEQILLEKLIGTRLVKKYYYFYGTVFARDSFWCLS